MAVTGKLPPVAEATKFTGEPTVAPFDGELTVTDCATPIEENANRLTKSLTNFFKT
jgi:hypothetical protein